MIRSVLAVFFCLFLNTAAFAAPPPLEAYGSLPGVELMSLSPSGNRFAFVAVVGEVRQLMVVSDKREPLLSIKTGNAKVRTISWVGEDRLLVWMTSTYDQPLEFDDAYEFTTVANIDIPNRTLTNIFAGEKKVSQYVFGYAGTARKNGRDYGYFVGITLELAPRQNHYEFVKDQRDLYEVDLETNKISRAAKGGDGPSFDWVVAADGTVLAHSEYQRETGTWRLFAGLNRDKLLQEKSVPFGDISLIGQGRKAGTVWVADSSSGIAVTEEIALADGKAETLFTDVSVSSYLSDPDTGLAIGATTLEPPRGVFFDEKMQARINGARKAFPNFQMELVSYSRNLDRLVVKTDGGDDSGTYWLVDIASKKADPIGYPYPQIRPSHVGPTQLITYKAGDGLDIQAVLTLPPGRKPEKLPLVVLPHGGPIGVSDAVGFEWWAQAYATNGYAVLQPNYRGSGGRGAEFERAGFGEWGRKMQTDLSDGVAALAAQGAIDPKRACIVGASYGGYAALAGVTLQQNIYRCAVSVAGLSSLSDFFQWQKKRHGWESGATRYWRAVTGADKEGDGVMRSLSPVAFAHKVQVPVLLIHGKDDTVVPIEQSERMLAALRSEDKPVEFVEMAGEDHWLSREETRKTMLKASVAFVLKHNPPD